MNTSDVPSNVPVKKHQVVIGHVDKEAQIIWFWAPKNISSKFTEYGLLRDTSHPEQFTLLVDPRYDFDDVVAYIESYEDL